MVVLCIGGCAAPETTTERIGNTEENVKSGATCTCDPPPPQQNYWDIAKCKWWADRPNGANYMSPWAAIIRGSGNGTPYPTAEIAWVAVYGKKANGQIVNLYYTPPGEHGLDTHGQWATRTNTLWFQPPYVDFPIPSGETFLLTLNRPYGTDIAHVWNKGEHIFVPADIVNVWVEAKVRLIGDARTDWGFDWYWAASGGAPADAGQGAFSAYSNGTACGNDWIIMSSPRRDDPNNCNPLVNTVDSPPPPSGKWTFDFTVNMSPQNSLEVYRKAPGVWQKLTTVSLGNGKYEATATDFLTSDLLVVQWTTNGTMHWACEWNGSTKVWASPFTATSPDGKAYMGYPKLYSSGNWYGCDMGIH